MGPNSIPYGSTQRPPRHHSVGAREWAPVERIDVRKCCRGRATWTCSGGHGPTDVRGTRRHAMAPQVRDTWGSFCGCAPTDARGDRERAPRPRKTAIWIFFNGCAPRAVRRDPVRALRQRKTAAWRSSGGCALGNAPVTAATISGWSFSPLYGRRSERARYFKRQCAWWGKNRSIARTRCMRRPFVFFFSLDLSRRGEIPLRSNLLSTMAVQTKTGIREDDQEIGTIGFVAFVASADIIPEIP